MIGYFQIAVVSLIYVSLTTCEPPSSQYGVPQGGLSGSYGAPTGGGGDGHGGYDNNEPKSYEFGYRVKDDYTGTNYNQREQSDGNQVRGEYKVNLPDGRTQIVTYWADWQTGFHADVRYEGEAQYPKTYGNGGQQYGAPPLGGGGGGGGYNGYSTPSSQYGVPQ